MKMSNRRPQDNHQENLIWKMIMIKYTKAPIKNIKRISLYLNPTNQKITIIQIHTNLRKSTQKTMELMKMMKKKRKK